MAMADMRRSIIHSGSVVPTTRQGVPLTKNKYVDISTRGKRATGLSTDADPSSCQHGAACGLDT